MEKERREKISGEAAEGIKNANVPSAAKSKEGWISRMMRPDHNQTAKLRIRVGVNRDTTKRMLNKSKSTHEHAGLKANALITTQRVDSC